MAEIAKTDKRARESEPESRKERGKRSPRRNEAYTQAVGSGLYVRQSGLHGKYDNVRLYWEDEITRLFLRSHVDRLVQRRVAELQRIRILDLGCGSGDGFEMLMRMVKKNPGINEDEVRVILPDYLGRYTGVDLNQALLEQSRQRWRDNPKMTFEQGDFSTGLPVGGGAGTCVYFSSFGTLSHLSEDQTVRLFCDIAGQADDGALVIGDWLGRYSYEWQELWQSDASQEQWMDYVISYIYPPGQQSGRELAPLDLRLLCREDVLRILRRVEDETAVRFEVKELFDRSLFVGRHMDTGDYNPHLTPIRLAVNSLHEDNQRTCLDKLLIDYHPHPDFPFVNQFFDGLHVCWNTLVRYAMELCHRFDDDKGALQNPPEIPVHYPEPLKRAMLDMKRVVEGAGWFRMGDPRANVIEPQLGYALRGLEMELQRGQGNGHGLVGVFEVRKA